jgi:hypothetical protein
MKILSWITLIVGAVVAVVGYRGVTFDNLTWLIVGLALSVILLAVGQLACCKKQ